MFAMNCDDNKTHDHLLQIRYLLEFIFIVSSLLDIIYKSSKNKSGELPQKLELQTHTN